MEFPATNSRKILFRPEKRIREGSGLKHLSSNILKACHMEEMNFSTVGVVKLWNGLTCDRVTCSSLEFKQRLDELFSWENMLPLY